MTHDTVLLVDDEALLRRLLSRMLIEAGWTVIQADNGQSALEAAREMDGDLGLVITDIHMPVMDGLALAHELQSIHPQVPVLYISGRDLPPSLAVSIPEERVLRKPFRTEFFIDAVQRLILRPA
jgi:two-component system, cell cycle sensor histidine kinase and response regulator CckA